MITCKDDDAQVLTFEAKTVREREIAGIENFVNTTEQVIEKYTQNRNGRLITAVSNRNI